MTCPINRRSVRVATCISQALTSARQTITLGVTFVQRATDGTQTALANANAVTMREDDMPLKRSNDRTRQHPTLKAEYVPITAEDVPEGLQWKKPGRGQFTSYSKPGNIFKRVVKPGEAVRYYRLPSTERDEIATPAAQIDYEPPAPKSNLVNGQQVRFPKGARLWFIDTHHWYLCEVVDRPPSKNDNNEPRMVIRPVTGRDDDNEVDWPYGSELEFQMREDSMMRQRIRHLSLREPRYSTRR